MMKIAITNKVLEKVKEDEDFAEEVQKAMMRYMGHDWGELGDSDKEVNDKAYKSGKERIVARYITSLGAIYIITEADRSATTILFATEY